MKDRRIVDFNENKWNDESLKRLDHNSSLRVKIVLKDLVKRIPRDYRCCEMNWGGPVGKEVL